MPQLSWFRAETETGGLIRFTTDTPPDEIAVWQANTLANDTGSVLRVPSAKAHAICRRFVVDILFGVELNYTEALRRGFVVYRSLRRIHGNQICVV